MFSAVPTIKSFRLYFRSFIQLIAVCALLYSPNAFGKSGPIAQEGLTLELPNNGNLRVENLRGGVIIDVWNESYVSVSAISDRGELGRLPAVGEGTDGRLAVGVNCGTDAPPRINLQ